MSEFVAGVLVTVYVIGLAYLVHEEHPKRSNFVLFVIWPITLAISPITTRIFRAWKYEKRLGTHDWDRDRVGLYLRPGRKHSDDGWAMFRWLFRKVRPAPDTTTETTDG